MFRDGENRKEIVMGYLKETMKRASVQSIREYLLYGVDGEEHTTKSYEARLKKAYDEWKEVVQEYDEEGEDSKLYCAVSNIITEYEHVYMEVGLLAGFRLAKEIERNGDDEKHEIKYKEMYSSLFQDVTQVIDELQAAQKIAEEIYISKETI